MRSLVFVLLCCTQCIQAQQFPPVNYPKGYFRNPLDLPMDLSGNFGELRPNHYHMGLDLKTLRVENKPVYAAADGYISRIKIEAGGFGRAIYINHPNGYTTLYAHLNDFNPRLEKWVKEQQYARESWNIFLELSPQQFPIKKGDFIAYSGNTGGSQAPHVHFEIRRTADDVNLNPMLFGFPLADNTSPRILRLAVYDRTKSIYEQAPKMIAVKAAGNNYATSPGLITVSSPKVSFAVTAFDTHTGSTNLNGIYEGLLYVDNEAVTGFRMDNISYSDTRYLNAHIDYRTKANGGAWLQHLSEPPGYINSIYKRFKGNGAIDVSDGLVHPVRIVVRDAYGNASSLEYSIQYNGHVEVPVVNDAKMFYPFMLDGFEAEQCEFYIGERSLYDSVHIKHSRSANTHPQAASDVHTIGAPTIPLQEAFLVRIQPTRQLTAAEWQKTVMQWYSGSKSDVQRVEWKNGWASARFRDFGSFRLLTDDTPPEIVPSGFADGANLSKATRLVFSVTDNLGRGKNVRTLLDGKWLRFTNDKGRFFIYKFDELCPPGSHELTISAEDEAGNRVEKSFRFTR
ncbi:peptidoglycan DD-metalloendopeptidase family protein [Paraflavitalea sp. CAU 1676]|uniref:peptidoglycan DD-metalloendopeptidase family protein n=1 Tax=Paraflavitalea sp. CAU 1676 TaxID=3032598 RepID=UPI0023DAC74C|nr:peptidoglycan DD-metalloendopeptidase family protein [Paraflavitalea sp. CAU 1676]MDF2193615.1 peptidoglycan DD-metalloendopeptidase family protein [Paraflavitalea sp. CAU 1676]